MKRTFALAFVLTLLVSALAGTVLVRVGIANPGPYNPIQLFPGWYTAVPPSSATIKIAYPKNGTICKGSQVPFSVSVTDLSADICSVSYRLDGLQMNKPAENHFTIYLTDLAEGNHTIDISVSKQNVEDYVWYSEGDHEWICHHDTAYSQVVFSYEEVSFTVDNTAPQILVISPSKSTYGSTVPLDFTVNEPPTQLFYSLDGNNNVSIAGNTTLTCLHDGTHSLTLYALDEVGNVGASSETIVFTVATFPTALVAVAILVSAVAISAGLLFYFKKHRR